MFPDEVITLESGGTDCGKDGKMTHLYVHFLSFPSFSFP